MQDVYVVDALRTPIAKYAGALSAIRPDDLLALTIKKIIERNSSLDLNSIEDVIAGAANQAGEDNRNVARMAALLAGLPVTVAGNTVNRLCASGLQAIMDAARAIACGDGDVFLAAGVESMTRAPFVTLKNNTPYSRNLEQADTTIGWRFTNKKLAEKYYPYSMGETAENVAKKYGITREQQDQFAFNSQEKYFKAIEKNLFADEIVEVEILTSATEKIVFAIDEHPRKTTLQKLATLKPAFNTNGTVTTGNSSGINDGAACMLLVNEKALAKNNLKPLVKIKSMAVAGVDPSIMGIGPVEATQKALKRAGLKISDIGLFELNEAFAVQAIACINKLNIDEKIVNVNGGSIALGHPLGCSGVRISATLIHQMKRTQTKYGIATMCVGVGQGAAVIYELV